MFSNENWDYDDVKVVSIQIENEYQTIESAFHGEGPRYVRWAAAMAVSLQTGVPWIMCKQMDAPDPVVSEIFHMSSGSLSKL